MPALVRVALAGLDLQTSPIGPAAPLTLRVGQQVLAQVLATEVETGKALLSLAGRHVQAQVPPGLEEGQVLRLAVAQIGAERLVLRLAGVAADDVGDAGIGQALDAAALAELDLPDTPELRAAAQALIARGQPLARETLLAIRAAIAGQPGTPDENAQAAAFLLARGLPLTPRSLALARNALTQPPVGDLLRDLLLAAGSGEDLPAGEPLLLGSEVLVPDAPEGPPPPAGQGTAPPAATTATTTGAPAGATSTGGTAPPAAQLPVAPGTVPSGVSGLPVPAVPAGPAGLPVPTAGAPVSAPADLAGPALPAAGAGQPAAPATPPLSLLSLAVTTPSAADLQRVAQLLTEGPEAKLLQAVIRRQAPPAELDGRQAVRTDAPGGTADVPAPAAPAVPDGRAALAALADAAGQAGAPAEAPAAAPQSETASLAAAPPPDGGPDPSPGGPSAPQPPLAAAVQALARALHDRIEMQQLDNAAALARQGRLLPAGGSPAEAAGTAGALAPGATRQTLSAPGTPYAPAPAAPAGAQLPSPADALPQLMLSLPLAVAGQFTTLELAVQREPPRRDRGGGKTPGTIYARFSLGLEQLGEVSADLRLTGTSLRCRLGAERPETQAVIQEAIGELEDRLMAAGLQVENLDCTLRSARAAPPPRLRRVDLGA